MIGFVGGVLFDKLGPGYLDRMDILGVKHGWRDRLRISSLHRRIGDDLGLLLIGHCGECEHQLLRPAGVFGLLDPTLSELR